MGSVLCKCRYEIPLTVTPAPDESFVIGAADLFAVLESIETFVDKELLARARLDGVDADLLNRVFHEEYPRDATLGEVIHDFTSDHLFPKCRSLLLCPSCGRILLERLENDPPGYDFYKFEES